MRAQALLVKGKRWVQRRLQVVKTRARRNWARNPPQVGGGSRNLHVFLHIPKTAGTYFNSIMAENVPGAFHEHVEAFLHDDTRLSEVCRSEGDVWLSGHVENPRFHNRLSEVCSHSKIAWYTLLRHPLHQFVSQISWQVQICLRPPRFLWGHPAHDIEIILSVLFADLANEGDLDRIMQQRPRYLDNNQSLVLGITSTDVLGSVDALNHASREAHAKLLALADFAVERDALQLISRCLHRPVESLSRTRENRNQSRCPFPEEVVRSESFIRRVVRINALDFVLYMNALQLSKDRSLPALTWHSVDELLAQATALCHSHPYRSEFDGSLQQRAREVMIAGAKRACAVMVSQAGD
jgi:hypothetical protein